MIKFLFGDKGSINLENRVYISVTIIGTIVGITSILANIYLGLHLLLHALVIIATIVYGFLYYNSRFNNKTNTTFLITFSLFVMSILWFLTGGAEGSTPLLFLIFMSAFVTITKSKYHLTLLLIALANLIVLYALEKLYQDKLIVKYPSAEARELDILFGYVSSIFTIFFVIRFFKRAYEKHNKRIQNQKIELQELNSSKELLFKIIAHDLRSPFNSILGLTDLMSDKSNNYSMQEMQRLAMLTNESSQKAFNMLESLLEWGKIQQGKVQFNQQKIELKKAVSNSVELFNENYSKINHKVSIRVPDETVVFVDSQLLQTIFRNLIHNAIKFTPQDGEIRISTENGSSDEVVVVVEDTGIGMNKEIIDNLFTFKSDSNRTGLNGELSTGLGLTICKELVEKQGGRIWVESIENKGSKFKFTLPKK